MFSNLWCVIFFLGFQGETVIQESLRVEYVLIDLIALDKNNQPIPNLRAQDFIVKDQGRKVDLESFQVLDFSGKELTSDGFHPEALEHTQVQTRQQFIFCLDLEGLNLTQTKKTFSQLRRAIKETTLPQNADYMLFSLNYGILTPGFVMDPEKLLVHLALFEDRVHDMRVRAMNTRYGRDDDETILDIPDPRDNTRPLPIGIPRGGTGITSLPNRSSRDSLRNEIEIEEDKLRAKLGLLESLAFKFRETPGLKTIFFISPGFSLNPGMVAIQERKNAARKAFARRTGANVLNSPPLEEMLSPNARSFHRQFEKVIHTCTKNRVVFHALNVYLSAQETSAVFKGQVTNLAERNDTAYYRKEHLRDYHKGLEQLSSLSGGMLSRGADLQATLETWIPRLKIVYLLGYTSPDGAPDTYRKIKIKCKRKGTKLHYRRGYFSAP